jgi:hypothetical protein
LRAAERTAAPAHTEDAAGLLPLLPSLAEVVASR